MDGSQFDSVSRFFADRRLSRRRALIESGAGLAAVGLATAGLTSASAQEATPAAAAEKAEFLFLQSFESAAIVPKADVAETYTLTLEHGLGQTIYFSDRPDRIVGAAPTPKFLDGLGFYDDNPPNAALLVAGDDGHTAIVVLELFAPQYDDASHTAIYDVKLMERWEKTLDIAFGGIPLTKVDEIPGAGGAYLFIDGCAERDVTCVLDDSYIGTIPSADFGGWCYDLLDCAFYCNPCTGPSRCGNATEYWNNKCNAKFSACANGCTADY
ncbi:MAG: hypothetical protein ACRDHN_04730 [Thermomicrobiales bacterium]